MESHKGEKKAHQADEVILDQLKLHFFNPRGFGKHLTELGFDLLKLSQVKHETIQKGEDLLLEISKILKKAEAEETVVIQQENDLKVKELSDEFYKLIPHLPTTQQSLLDKKINIDSKFSLVKNLHYVLDAFDAINRTQSPSNFLAKLYENLKYNVYPLEKKTSEYELIERYGNENSVASNSILYPQVSAIFKCELKEGETVQTSEKKQKTLLWYGDRICSYAGILGQGVQYPDRLTDVDKSFFSLSDSVIKSMSSCYLDRGDREAFLLLCEVDLEGNKDVATYEDVNANNQTEGSSLRSAKVVGKMSTANENTSVSEGVDAPLGKLEAINQDAKILYNDFLIFNQDQIQLRYIVKFSIKSQ